MPTRLRKRSSIDIDHIGLYSWMIQNSIDQWLFEMIKKPQSHWKITCTDNQKTISSRFRRSIKTDKDDDATSQKHVVKVSKLIHKLGGHFGQVRRLLHFCGRVTNGMNGITTTQNTWWRIWQGTKKSVFFVVQEFYGHTFNERTASKSGETLFFVWFSIAKWSLLSFWFFFQLFRRISFTVDEIHCNRREVYTACTSHAYFPNF